MGVYEKYLYLPLKFAVKQNFSKNPKKRKSNDFETSQTEQN